MELVYARRGHFDYVRHVEIANDDSFFVTTGQDGSARVWRNDVPVCRDHRSAVGWSDFGIFFYTSHVVIHIKIFLPSSKKNKHLGP